ncbi:hypothetical protein ACM1RC_04730 [Paenibacillus azoreducens]|uniref:hypothetical protein n=1 Tax=Paenibacillus azoreducens TaxID=116718 RepID=UPI0039F4CECA
MSNTDKEKQVLGKTKTVYETGGIITTKVYRVSKEQKEDFDRPSDERLEISIGPRYLLTEC